jgi:hypothetical protein
MPEKTKMVLETPKSAGAFPSIHSADERCEPSIKSIDAFDPPRRQEKK